ncbi:MAG: hypothetical protein HDR88_14985 [Bacteroides sp.]|nr:hypothetical protein [Bacteroides sp.]
MKVLKLFAFMAVCLLMAACGGNEASKVEEKVKSGAELTQADYTVMIDYCGKYAEEAQKIQDEINNLPDESKEMFNLEEKMAALSNSYPYTTTFLDKIANSSEEAVGTENAEKIKKYAPLEWFSAPAWAMAADNNNVVGFIEEMPSSDSTGVISQGSGVEVAK